MADDIINHCEYKNMMPYCAKKEEQDEQEKCSYYEKASHFNRCMYLKFDEYCDNVKAKLKVLEGEKK